MEHYRLQSVEELKDGNRLNFMFVWVHTFTRRKCVDAVTSGFMKDFRESILTSARDCVRQSIVIVALTL